MPVSSVAFVSSDGRLLDWKKSFIENEEIQDSVQSCKVVYSAKGLRNLGNTCYLNSVLQCLLFSPGLASYMLSSSHSNLCSAKRSMKFCFFCIFEEFFGSYVKSSSPITAPTHIYKNLKFISKSLKPGRQEDAHEFLRRFTEACEPPSVSTGVFNRVFGGNLRSRVTCSVCKSASDCFDPYMDISLDITRSTNSVLDCLKKFTEIELLGANSYSCKVCCKKVLATKQFTIETIPHSLTLHLKRFDSFQRKLHRRVSFPVELDMSHYLSDISAPLVYQLYSVVVHSGSTLTNGHYYSYQKAPSGVWFRTDDESVSRVKMEAVLQEASGAYLLMYSRQSGDPRSSTILSQSQEDAVSIQKSLDLKTKETDLCYGNFLLASGTFCFGPSRRKLLSSRQLIRYQELSSTSSILRKRRISAAFTDVAKKIKSYSLAQSSLPFAFTPSLPSVETWSNESSSIFLPGSISYNFRSFPDQEFDKAKKFDHKPKHLLQLSSSMDYSDSFDKAFFDQRRSRR
jgi:ubiquitin C-terminal hydrolase